MYCFLVVDANGFVAGSECPVEMYNFIFPLKTKSNLVSRCEAFCASNLPLSTIRKITYDNTSAMSPSGVVQRDIPIFCNCFQGGVIRLSCSYPGREVYTNPARSWEQCYNQMGKRGLQGYWQCIKPQKRAEGGNFYCSTTANVSAVAGNENLETSILGLLDTWSLVNCTEYGPESFAPTPYSRSLTKSNNFWNIFSYEDPATAPLSLFLVGLCLLAVLVFVCKCVIGFGRVLSCCCSCCCCRSKPTLYESLQSEHVDLRFDEMKVNTEWK